MSTSTVVQPSPGAIATSVAAVIDAINGDSAKAEAVFTARSVLTDGLKADVNIRGFGLVSDEPASLGGTDLGPNPVELVLGALGACQEIVIKAYASVLGVPLSSVAVEARGHLNLKGFFNQDENVRPGFHTVQFNTRIETSETDPQKLQLLQFFAENRCPVLDIIKNPVHTTGNVTFAPPAVAQAV
jgi:uncharacterized OsmC-like protein